MTNKELVVEQFPVVIEEAQLVELDHSNDRAFKITLPGQEMTIIAFPEYKEVIWWDEDTTEKMEDAKEELNRAGYSLDDMEPEQAINLIRETHWEGSGEMLEYTVVGAWLTGEFYEEEA